MKEVKEQNPIKECDHTSVGIHVWRNGRMCLIERKKFPFGFAPPAGHCDGDSYEDAAKRELKEEVGLLVRGTWHYWKIYDVEAEGEIQRSLEETKQAGWYSKEQIEDLARRTEEYLEQRIPEEDWQKSPGLEPVWYRWMKELKII